ncbi:MAG: glycosyltransferase family 4 protein [Bacteroidota bacterium]
MLNKIFCCNRKAQSISYVSDGADWVLTEIAKSLKYVIEKNVRFEIVHNSEIESVDKTIYHYSSVFDIDRILSLYNKRSKHILTNFHTEEIHYYLLDKLILNQKKFDFIHTSCIETRDIMIKRGLDTNKIVVIPIGIDVSRFNVNDVIRKQIREEIGVSDSQIVIGSFQKDGNGWEEGLEPKLIKGPDIFCDAVIEIHKIHPVFILLTGPARGYVKKRLQEAGVPYYHKMLDNYYDVSNYFKGLDVYFVASRLEGGPRAPMEAMASGIPVISTKVGQVPELIEDRRNGLMVDFGGKTFLSQFESLFADSNLRLSIIQEGLKDVQKFDFSVIAERYYNELYKPLIVK